MPEHKLIVVLCAVSAYLVTGVCILLHYVSRGDLSETFDRMLTIMLLAAAVIFILAFVGVCIVDRVDKQRMFKRER